jgi:osmoprotectant transport system permease protein
MMPLSHTPSTAPLSDLTTTIPTWLYTILQAFVQHVDLCVISLVLSILIAFPVSLWIARRPVLAEVIMAVFSLLYTIPSLALLAILVTLFGLGMHSALISLVIYAQFILLRHFVLGLRAIDPSLLEIARGLGMTPFQIFKNVEIPLALPVWISGLRVATLSTLSIATTAAWINAGGLGTFIFEGLSQDNPAKILTGAVLIALLSLLFEQILRAFEEQALLDAQGNLST